MIELEDSDIQGNVLHPYRCGDGDGDYLDHAAYVFLEVGDRAAAADWLSRLPVTDDRAARHHLREALNVAFTWRGLQALGQPADRFSEFEAFVRGMPTPAPPPRGEDDPDQAWAGTWAAGKRRRHVLVTLHRTTDTERNAALDALCAGLPADVLTPVGIELGSRLASGREHFGFKDGLSQPAVEGTARHGDAPGPPGDGVYERRRWRRLKAGEFILGYRDEQGALPPAPEHVGKNGTFAVWQRLAQDVPMFRRIAADVEKAAARFPDPPRPVDAVARLLARAGWDTSWTTEDAAARLVGRRQDGTALARRTRVSNDAEQANEFSYGGDPAGQRCPLGAHVRRANPRDAFGFGFKLTRRHRIIRRGLPYGPAYDKDHADIPRGLVFMCFNASIERQFEVVQRWCEDGTAFRLGDDRDLLAPGGDGRTDLRVTGRRPAFLTAPAPVRYTGGEYLFLPGLTGLRRILSEARQS